MCHVLNLTSYFSGFIGTLILIKYGIPEQIDTKGQNFLALEQESEDDKNKIQRYKYYSRFGLVFLSCSFLLQIISEFKLVRI